MTAHVTLITMRSNETYTLGENKVIEQSYWFYICAVIVEWGAKTVKQKEEKINN